MGFLFYCACGSSLSIYAQFHLRISILRFYAFYVFASNYGYDEVIEVPSHSTSTFSRVHSQWPPDMQHIWDDRGEAALDVVELPRGNPTCCYLLQFLFLFFVLGGIVLFSFSLSLSPLFLFLSLFLAPFFLCALRANWPRDGDKSSLNGRRPSAQTILLFSPVKLLPSLPLPFPIPIPLPIALPIPVS